MDRLGLKKHSQKERGKSRITEELIRGGITKKTKGGKKVGSAQTNQFQHEDLSQRKKEEKNK